jgi:hypothetical protein
MTNEKKVSILLAICATCFCLKALAQVQSTRPDLSNKNNLRAVNRDVTVSQTAPGKIFVHLNAKPGNGVVWINDLALDKGNLEFDVKGKNVLQQSFVGIAFHGVNDSTYDAVYFRPFNFESPDSIRKNHSVQYISLPQYDWSVLREKYPGKYESSLLKAPGADDWFHVKVVIDTKGITAYVNGDEKPSLVVEPISTRSTGKVGFWVGNNSEGDFSNLIVQKK